MKKIPLICMGFIALIVYFDKGRSNDFSVYAILGLLSISIFSFVYLLRKKEIQITKVSFIGLLISIILAIFYYFKNV